MGHGIALELYDAKLVMIPGLIFQMILLPPIKVGITVSRCTDCMEQMSNFILKIASVTFELSPKYSNGIPVGSSFNPMHIGSRFDNTRNTIGTNIDEA